MTLAKTINFLLTAVETLIMIRVILSWIPINRDMKLIRLLYQLTEPVLGPIRRMIEKSPFGSNLMFDFSPVIVWLIIRLIRTILLR